MKPILATAWRPHARSIDRLRALFPMIERLYSGVSIVTPPNLDAGLRDALIDLPLVTLSVRDGNRRLQTLKQALTLNNASHIHYCDGDHVVARLEQNPDDWESTLAQVTTADCLIIGRTENVFESYPVALRETERTINRVASYLLRHPTDLGAGARGFSREAVQYICKHASAETHPIATDSEYPILLQQAGFLVKTIFSEGTIYEVENEAHATQLASVAQWEKSVKLADKIIATAIETAKNPPTQ